jgi:hypothetical protein
MRAVKIEDGSRTQPGGDGLSRKNQNRPVGEKTGHQSRRLSRTKIASQMTQLLVAVNEEENTFRSSDSGTVHKK